MSHWFPADEDSRGRWGEVACLTFRGCFTRFTACQGVVAKSADHVHDFLVKLRRPSEKYVYFHADGARELAQAARALHAAHDSAIPGDKRQNAVAERTNGLVEEGARALLMSAWLPPAFWPYAVQRWCLAHNAQPKDDEDTLGSYDSVRSLGTP